MPGRPVSIYVAAQCYIKSSYWSKILPAHWLEFEDEYKMIQVSDNDEDVDYCGDLLEDVDL